MNYVSESPAEYSSGKKSANLSINADLLAEAKQLGINLSQAFESHLHALVRQEKQRRWQTENAPAIAAYNHHLERDGVWGAEWRQW